MLADAEVIRPGRHLQGPSPRAKGPGEDAKESHALALRFGASKSPLWLAQ